MRVETIALLKLTEAWQKAIVTHCQQHSQPLDVKQVTIHLSIILLCLYWCEKHQVLPIHGLKSLAERDDIGQAVNSLWQELGDRFGHPWRHFTFPDHFSPQLLQSLVSSLYYPQAKDISIESLGQVYERLLSLFDAEAISGDVTTQKLTHFTRKIGGVYYTPQSIVRYVVNATIDRILKSTDRPRILDPTCGSGAFLIAAYQALIDRQLQAARPIDQTTSFNLRKLDFKACQNLLQLIHGVDIDSEAVGLTQLCLSLKLIENVEIEQLDQLNVSIDLSQNIQWGNALVKTASAEARSTGARSTGAEPARTKSFGAESASTAAVQNQHSQLGPSFADWQTAFPEAIDSGGFDVVIGNPPYLDAEAMSIHLPKWRSYCTAHYYSASGNWDLFCIFIEKAVQLCRMGGLTSLVIPNKFLSAGYAASARSVLLQTSQILTIRDYAQVDVFAALVYPIVYIAQKAASDSVSIDARDEPETTQYERMNSIDQVDVTHSIILSAKRNQAWVMGISSQTDLLQRLDRFPKLGELTQVSGAATVTEAYQLKPLLQNQRLPAAGDLTVVNSGTIDRYQLLWGQKALRYLGDSYLHPIVAAHNLPQLPQKRWLQAQQPKIIVAGMVQRLEAALDPIGGIVAAKSTTIIQTKPQQAIDLRYILGILNSSLISWLFQIRFSGNRLQGGYLRVGPPQLRQLPIVVPNFESFNELKLYNQLIELVNQQGQFATCSTVDEQIDQIVYQLYQLTRSETELIQF